MITSSNSFAETRNYVQKQLLLKYGFKHKELISEVLDNNSTLLLKENPFRELEKTLKMRLNTGNQIKSKLMVKPQVAKRLSSLNKQLHNFSGVEVDHMNLNHTPLSNFHTSEKKVARFSVGANYNPFSEDRESKWRLLSNKEIKNGVRRSTHFTNNFRQSTGGDLIRNFDTFRSNNRITEEEERVDYENNITSMVNKINFGDRDRRTNFSINERGSRFMDDKPRSLLKKPRNSNMAFETQNNNHVSKADKMFYKTVSRNELRGNVLQSLSVEPINHEKETNKRNKSRGNFITGRMVDQLKKIDEENKMDSSFDGIFNPILERDLNEIVEIASREGSFISQDFFMIDKDDKKKEVKTPVLDVKIKKSTIMSRDGKKINSNNKEKKRAVKYLKSTKKSPSPKIKTNKRDSVKTKRVTKKTKKIEEDKHNKKESKQTIKKKPEKSEKPEKEGKKNFIRKKGGSIISSIKNFIKKPFKKEKKQEKTRQTDLCYSMRDTKIDKEVYNNSKRMTELHTSNHTPNHLYQSSLNNKPVQR